MTGGVAALAVWGGLLVLLPVAVALGAGGSPMKIFDSFYRSGSLVFGGGHVVLPLLRAEVVARHGWMNDNVFLAGYGAAQAVPGPLFSFAAYLGVVMNAGWRGVAGGLWALLGLYLPAWLLVGGTLPLWERARGWKALRPTLAGASAAVVGVLFAALCGTVFPEAISGWRDFGVALAAFVALAVWRVPAWAIALACAGAGAVFL